MLTFSFPPLAPLTLCIILVAAWGGYRPALATAFLAIIYLAFDFALPGMAFKYSDENLVRLIVWSLTFMLVALIVGLLKNRTELGLQRELRRRIEQEENLRASEARNRAIIDSAYDAFIAIDQEGHVIEWNPQAEKNFGWLREEALGKTLPELIIPLQFQSAHTQGLKKHQLTGEGGILNRRIEVPARHKNGSVLAMELTVYPIRQNEGLIFGAFLHDISERKRREKLALCQLNSSHIMSEVSDLEESLPLMLKEICTAAEWTLAELWIFEPHRHSFTCPYLWSTDPTVEKIFREENPPHLSAQQGLLGHFRGDGKPEWLKDLPNGSLPRAMLFQKTGLETMIYAEIYDREKLLGLFALYDREARKSEKLLISLVDDFAKRLGLYIRRVQAEAEVKNLYRDLERKVEKRTEELAAVNQMLKTEAVEKEILYEQARTANRLKDEFLATISHELRTPMNVILGHSELLHDDGLNPEEQRSSIEAIYRNTKAQVHIVNDILDVSKFITGKLQMNMEVVDMAEIIAKSIESIAPAAAAKDIQLTESISVEAGLITGDPTRLQQVLWNLLSNAVKFTPRHGKIHISLTSAESNLVVTIKDSGKGIDPSFLPYVFDRFRQEDSATTRRFGGLGLGLAITKNIVEAHGGSIQAFSEGKNQGSTFSVILPLTSVRSHILSEDDDEDLRSILQGLHILVVDDQEDALALEATVLKKHGAQVTKASSATEAFQKLIRIRPDLLISDIGMPEKDGYELISMVRQLPPEMGGHTPALALTAYAQEEDQKKTKNSGYEAHLAKPIEGRKLIRGVAKLMGRLPAAH